MFKNIDENKLKIVNYMEDSDNSSESFSLNSQYCKKTKY